MTFKVFGPFSVQGRECLQCTNVLVTLGKFSQTNGNFGPLKPFLTILFFLLQTALRMVHRFVNSIWNTLDFDIFISSTWFGLSICGRKTRKNWDSVYRSQTHGSLPNLSTRQLRVWRKEHLIRMLPSKKLSDNSLRSGRFLTSIRGDYVVKISGHFSANCSG